MKTAIKFIVGSIGALVLLWLAVTIYGLAAAYLPIPHSWWAEHSTEIIYGTELISFLPFAFVGAFASRLLFKHKSILWSFLCFLAAFIVNFGSVALESTELVGPALRLTIEFVFIFVVGVPALVFLLERWHANKLSEPTP